MIDIMVDLQGNGSIPLYEKIYEYIKKELIDGKILNGEKLPSTRLLARNLSVSRSTVELAYAQLAAEGFIKTMPRRGYFACDIGELYRLSGGREEKRNGKGAYAAKQKAAIDFSPDRIDTGSFPFGVFRRLHKTILLEENGELLEVGDGQGEAALRAAIAGYLHQARGVNCMPEDIVIGAGNEYLQMLLVQLLGGGRTVFMEDPGYPQAYRTFSSMGYRVFAAPVSEEGINLSLLYEKSPDIVYVMPSHQFPLGFVMPMEQRLALLKWAAEEDGRYIIEDDHDSEYRYRGKPIPALQGIDHDGKVIYLGTFSKSIAPSLRISYMALPPQLTSLYRARCGFYSATIPRMQQEILCAFIKEGHFERHLNKMRGLYRGKRDFLLGELKRYPWAERVSGDYAGLHVLVRVRTDLCEEEICIRAKEAGVLVFGISKYRLDGRKSHAGAGGKQPVLLLGYGKPREQEIVEGLKILNQIFLRGKG